MRILVTGAAGFFGSRALMHLSRDAEVHGVDRPGADRARVEALAPSTKLHDCDLAEPGALESLVAAVRPDLAIHLAWYAVPGKYLNAPENLDHLAASLRLARALAESGCKRLVTAGTCFEYDTTLGLLSESTPCEPRFLYSATKHAMFESLREACRVWSVSYAHARFFYQYGPWEAPGRLVPAVIAPLLRGEPANVTTGDQVRDFLHVDDVARALTHVAHGELTGPVNVGSGVPVRVCDVVRAAAKACGREELVRYGALPSREGDPPFICADVTKLRSTGFTPRFDPDTGLADTVAWYREQASASKAG